MGQALYRKYRSKSLNEIVGQEHITNTLEQALKQGRISHAYLFTGPRGVGKTSIARILAHEINDLPYTDDSTHLDIIEIDAASNRRIDEIRELRDKVYVAPTSAKYKVYIIDEVHMLTKEAFNALLKTLEEPPAHVVFILATTDAHKLPETIVSRTQRFSFKPVEKSKVVDHLQSIAKEENIKVSPEALELLAEHGEGSFRDSISLLDQASNHSRALTAEDVHTLLGIPHTTNIHSLHKALGGTSAEIINNLETLYDQGFQAAAIAKQLGRVMRQSLIEGQTHLNQNQSLQLLEQLIAVPAAHDPERFLEIVLLQTSQPSNTAPLPVKEEIAEPVRSSKATAVTESAKKSVVGNAAMDETVWPEVLQALKQKHNTIYSVVRMAQPTFEAGSVSLAFAFAFHQKRINENGSRQLLGDIIKELTGQDVSIECLVDSSAKPLKVAVPPPKPAPNGNLAAISNIFGAAELLES
jgi:DNA polymerase-3 subunit gamma/tau